MVTIVINSLAFDLITEDAKTTFMDIGQASSDQGRGTLGIKVEKQVSNSALLVTMLFLDCEQILLLLLNLFRHLGKYFQISMNSYQASR